MRRVVLKSPVLENCTPGSVRGPLATGVPTSISLVMARLTLTHNVCTLPTMINMTPIQLGHAAGLDEKIGRFQSVLEV